MTRDAPPEVAAPRLGHLLTHAYVRLAQESARALAPYGLDGRELAVLAVLEAHDGLTQSQAAGRLGVDRTTMVALIDTLEAEGLAERHRSTQDRRRNVVRLTGSGRERLREGEAARREVERAFLAPLAGTEAEVLVRGLRVLARGAGASG